jgi:hypothetical protein
VSMYVCGPTVYGVPHLGHGRFSLVFDVLRRYLLFTGLEVTYVSNITDIDDKIIERARPTGASHRRVHGGQRGPGGRPWTPSGCSARRDAPRHRLRRPDGRPGRDLVERGVAYETATASTCR